MQKEKSYNRNKTFQNRFVLYCWCADWYLGQGSREYRLLCRLRLWLKKFFDGEVEWQKYYDSHYLRVEKSKLYKELVAGYIEKPKKIKTENGFAEELFCLLKQTSHTAVRFCGWELDLREWRALPPHGLRGYGSTAYRGCDPGNDGDLRFICKDFVKTALYSRRHQKKEVSAKFITRS